MIELSKYFIWSKEETRFKYLHRFNSAIFCACFQRHISWFLYFLISMNWSGRWSFNLLHFGGIATITV